MPQRHDCDAASSTCASLTGASNSANMRSIFDFSVVNAKIADRLAEGVEFEPSGDLVNGQ
jgi:hypothetical protein